MRLVNIDGRWINPDLICYIAQRRPELPNLTEIWFVSDRDLVVQMSVDKVIRAISGDDQRDIRSAG